MEIHWIVEQIIFKDLSFDDEIYQLKVHFPIQCENCNSWWSRQGKYCANKLSVFTMYNSDINFFCCIRVVNHKQSFIRFGLISIIFCKLSRLKILKSMSLSIYIYRIGRLKFMELPFATKYGIWVYYVLEFNRFVNWFMCFIFRFLVILRPSAVKCAFPFLSPVKHDDNIPNKLDDRLNRAQVSIGPCKWIFNEKCPHSDIRFYLYTRKNPQDRQLIHVDEAWDKSNLSGSNFNPNDPTKIILHGYNSDMFLTPLIQMKGGMTILPTIRWLSLPETVLQLLTFWTLLKVLHWSAIQFVRNLLFEITVSMRLMTRTHEKLEQLCSSLASFSVVVSSFNSMQFIPFLFLLFP